MSLVDVVSDKLTVLSVPGEHKDLIHDLAYDFHGRRIATCSSDQNVKVWDLNEHGRWIVSSSWKTHNGPVWRVAWAHPEFGQVLATCSFDRTASIWEEVPCEEKNCDKKTVFAPRAKLVDSRSNVTDVKFAPRHLGLVLATCSQNGILRIYEAADIMKLSEWNLQHDTTVFKSRCGCLSWSTSKYHPPLIAVGCDEPSLSCDKVVIFEMNESTRKWSRVASLEVSDPVYDVKFAPNVGRSYHMLAVASKDLRIYCIRPQCTEMTAPASSKYEIQQMAALDEHNGQVWRVSWNITGTVLASLGADGIVKLWKANFTNNWTCIETIRRDDRGTVYDSSMGLKIDTNEKVYW